MPETAGAGPVGALTGIWFLVFGYVVLAVVPLVMTIVAVVDIAGRPDWQWKLVGTEKITWLLLVILLNVFAITSLIYWFGPRKKLIALQEAASSGAYGPGRAINPGWQPSPFPTSPYGGIPVGGWFADPSGAHRFRWWDGVKWTNYTWDDAAPPG